MTEKIGTANKLSHREIAPLGETISKLSTLIGNKRKVLCVGSTTLPLAQKLHEHLNCFVTVLVDPSDFVVEKRPEHITLIIESLAECDITKRFLPSDFEVVLLAEGLSQISNYSGLLSKLLAYFTNAVVISIPHLFDNKQALINAQSHEIKRLKEIIRVKDESLSWHTKRLREHLTNHYKHQRILREKLELERSSANRTDELMATINQKDYAYSLLHQDRERIYEAYTRLKRYSPDSLPKILRYPLKAGIALLSYGPFEPLRILKKKVAAKDRARLNNSR